MWEYDRIMTKCHRCKVDTPTSDMIGVNVFDALTGMHIITRRYCRFCASTLTLLKTEQYPQATTEGDAL